MKPYMKLTSILLIFLALVLLAGCSPIYNVDTGGLVVGQSYRLRSGQTLNEDLTVVGGSAELEEGSTVNGNVAILGGSSVNQRRGHRRCRRDGRRGVPRRHRRDPRRTSRPSAPPSRDRKKPPVLGSIGTGQPTFHLPGSPRPSIRSGIQIIWDFISPIFQAFALAALAVLVSLFALRPMEHIGDAMTSQSVTAGGIGLLSAGRPARDDGHHLHHHHLAAGRPDRHPRPRSGPPLRMDLGRSGYRRTPRSGLEAELEWTCLSRGRHACPIARRCVDRCHSMHWLDRTLPGGRSSAWGVSS